MPGSDDTLTGQLIDRRWRVVRRLGGGGMGTVYEVEHHRLLLRRALKLIKRDLASDQQYRQRFFAEATRLKQVPHQNIPALYDFEEDSEHGLFIVMELIRGTNLKDLIKEHGRLPYADVLRIGKEVAAALDCVHRLGTVHRDIKPANIIIEEEGRRAVVTDFGIAKDLQADETLTGTLEVVGTVGYASPEQLTGEKSSIDQRTDIFSLGAVLFEMYAGKYYGGLGAIAGRAPKLKYPERPPPEFKIVVEGCLAGDLDARIPTAADLIRMLEDCEAAYRVVETSARGPASGVAPVEPSPLAAGAADDTSSGTPQATAMTSGGLEDATRATIAGTQIDSPRPPVTPPAPPDSTTAIQLAQAQERKDTELRSQLEVQLRDIGKAHEECLALQQYLSEFGVSATGFIFVEELEDRLRAVSEETDLESRRARLDGLLDHLRDTRGEIEAALRSAAGEALEALEARCRGVEGLGSPFSDDGEVAQLDAALERCRGLFEAGDWAGARQLVDQVTVLVGDAESAAQARGSELVERGLRQADDVLARIAPLWPADREPPASGRTRDEARGLLDARRLPEARDRVEQLVLEAGDLLARLEEARDRTIRARGAAAEARAALPPDAGEDAAEQLRAAAEAGARGEEAETARDFDAATTHYERERALYAEAVEALEEARARRAEAQRAAAAEARAAAQAVQSRLADLALEGREQQRARQALAPGDDAYDRHEWETARRLYEAAGEDLRRLESEHLGAVEAQRRRRADEEAALGRELERAQQAPPSLDLLLGASMATAETLLAGERPADFAAEMAALEQARQRLAAALEERPAFEQATSARAQAGAAREHLGELPLDGNDIEPVDALLGEAEQLLGRRSWASAAAAYARAAEECRRLESEHLHRENLARVARSRRDAEQAAAGVDPADAAELAAERFAGAGALRAEAQRAEAEGRDLPRAAALFEQAGAAYAEVAATVERLLTQGLERAEEDLGAAVELAAGAAEALVGPERDEATRLLRGQGPPLARERIAALRAAQSELEQALGRQEAYEQALAADGEARAAWARATARDLTAAEMREGEGLLQRAAALLEERDWVGAEAACGEAVRGIARLEAEARLRQEAEQTRSAREAAEIERGRLDLRYAAEVAEEDLRGGEALWQRASEAEERRDFVPATQAFEEAGRAWAALRERVEAAKLEARAAAETDLRQSLVAAETAPEELAGGQRQRATALLAGPRPSDFGDEIAALIAARTELDAAVALRSAYEQAVALRAEIAAIGERVAGAERKPTWAQRRALAAFGAPAAAERQGNWAGAAEQYAAARQGLLQLEEELKKPPPPPWPLAKIAAGIGTAALLTTGVIYGPDLYERIRAREETKEQKTEVPRTPVPNEADRPPLPPPWSIARFSPADEAPAVREGGKLAFSIQAAGGAAGEKPEVKWLLDGKEVAAGSPGWEYAPGFADAGAHTVVASLDGGKATREWKLDVADQNRKPSVEADPAPGKVPAKIGDNLRFTAKATDEDTDDRLKYQWSVDGRKLATTEPQLELPVTGAHKVALATSDGKDSVTTAWEVLAKVPPLALEVSPKQADALPFGDSRKFSLSVPAGVSATGLAAKWKVDGGREVKGLDYTFAADDPKYVRSKPVQVAVAATDAQGATFSYDWSFKVLPPPRPELDEKGTTPAATTVDAEAGEPVEFRLAAARPARGQQLTYVFSVDGKERQRGSDATFALTPSGDQGVTVSARLEDNFKQASAARSWKLQISGIAARARQWLAEYQSAFRSKNAARIGELRGLAAGDVSKMQGSFDIQRDRQVTFSKDEVEALGGNRARVSYENDVSFSDSAGGEQNIRARCVHVLELRDGRLVDTAKSPCQLQ